MALVVIYRAKGMDPEKYAQFRRSVPLDQAPPEALLHLYARGADDELIVVDVWQEPEAMRRFGEEQIRPGLEKAGLPYAEPEIVELKEALVGARAADVLNRLRI